VAIVGEETRAASVCPPPRRELKVWCPAVALSQVQQRVGQLLLRRRATTL